MYSPVHHGRVPRHLLHQDLVARHVADDVVGVRPLRQPVPAQHDLQMPDFWATKKGG